MGRFVNYCRTLRPSASCYPCGSRVERSTVTIKKEAEPKKAVAAVDVTCRSEDGTEATRTHDVLIDRRRGGRGPEARDTISLYVGAPEHAFFTAALPVTELTQLKYDADKNTVVELKKPATFMIGVNWSPWGDIRAERGSFGDHLFATVLVKPSSKPLDQFGVGAGLRLWDFGEGLDLSGLTLFGARVWTRGDKLNKADGSKVGTRYDGSWQYGVGFNASKIVEWLKKDSAKSEK